MRSDLVSPLPSAEHHGDPRPDPGEGSPARSVQHRYADPLDQIWLETARRIGLRTERSRHAYASTDGRGLLLIGSAETLDPDDCLAQMIFHELCHSLIEGPAAFTRPDWGLDNTSGRDTPREHACLRVQATLAAEHGLRRILAPTTDFRAFYDQLGPDALEPAYEPSVVLARMGLSRVTDSPWAPHLEAALRATAAIARQAASFAGAQPGPAAELPTLWQLVEPEPARHPTGFVMATVADPARTCGTCAWHYRSGPGRPVNRCQQADGGRVSPAWGACNRWEPPLDCLDCGACCREAYDSVTVSPRDPVIRRHPALVVDRGSYVEMVRSNNRCIALERTPMRQADGSTRDRYHCRIYDERPRLCHEFELAGENCLYARRQVGLSR